MNCQATISLRIGEITALLQAIDMANQELCTGPGFDEANDLAARLNLIKARLMDILPIANGTRKATP